MRRAAVRPSLLIAARATATGALLGALATGAMYGVAAVELAATGVPTGAWGAAIETGFGGNLGSILGWTGLTLHAVHGVALGALVGLLIALIRTPRTWAVLAAGVGLPVGLLLWGALLGFAPTTRALDGPGPPLVLSLVMHLAFGVVVAGGAVLVRRPPSSGAMER